MSKRKQITGMLVQERLYILSKYGDRLYLDDGINAELAILRGDLPKTETVTLYEAVGDNRAAVRKSIQAWALMKKKEGKIIFINK